MDSPPTSASSSAAAEAQQGSPAQGGSGTSRPRTLEDMPKHSTSSDKEAAASPPKVRARVFSLTIITGFSVREIGRKKMKTKAFVAGVVTAAFVARSSLGMFSLDRVSSCKFAGQSQVLSQCIQMAKLCSSGRVYTT